MGLCADFSDRDAIARSRRVAAPDFAERVESGGNLDFKRIQAVIFGMNGIFIFTDFGQGRLFRKENGCALATGGQRLH